MAAHLETFSYSTKNKIVEIKCFFGKNKPLTRAPPVDGLTCSVDCDVVVPFFMLRDFLFSNMTRLSSLEIEGLRTEDVVHVADCEAHGGNMIVIFLATQKQLR